MKKTISFMLLASYFLASTPNVFATAVTASRANDANDLTAGAVFDNAGAWTLTVSDNADFTTGVVTVYVVANASPFSVTVSPATPALIAKSAFAPVPATFAEAAVFRIGRAHV